MRRSSLPPTLSLIRMVTSIDPPRLLLPTSWDVFIAGIVQKTLAMRRPRRRSEAGNLKINLSGPVTCQLVVTVSHTLTCRGSTVMFVCSHSVFFMTKKT